MKTINKKLIHYNKIVKCINSCITFSQLKSSMQMVENFHNLFKNENDLYFDLRALCSYKLLKMYLTR